MRRKELLVNENEAPLVLRLDVAFMYLSLILAMHTPLIIWQVEQIHSH